MEVSELNERIKKGQPLGRYIFGGEEDYLKRFYSRELVKATLGDADDIFSHTVFDGEDASASEVAEAIISPALMSEYKVVEWRFPDFSSMREKELAQIEELAAVHDKNPDTVLILTVSAEGFEFSQGKTKSKLEKSQFYLTHTELSIQEIAAKLAFSSATHYINTFTKYYRLTPLLYRKDNR